MLRLLELLIVVTACLSPIFLRANSIDADEYIKASQGTAQAVAVAGVIAVYKLWSANRKKQA